MFYKVKAYVLPRKCTTLTTQVSLTFRAKMGHILVVKNSLLSNVLTINKIQNGHIPRI